LIGYHAAAQEIIDAFHEVPPSNRLELLLEYADSLPELPERFRDRPELLERVEECQSPVYLFTEVNSAGLVNVYLTASVEAPTTRGFAAILSSALNNQSSETVLNFSDAFVNQLNLTNLVSPLRIRGLYGMLTRIKRQVRENLDNAE